MQAHAVYSIKLTINCTMMALATIRLYILHFKQRRRTIYDILSHIVIYSAIMVDNVACGTSVWVLKREIATIKQFGEAEAQHMVATRTNLTILFWSHLCYYLSLCIIKLAYLVFYSQLFSKIQGWRRGIMYAAGGIWALSYIAGFLMIFLWCSPFSGNMMFPPVNSHCPMMFTVTAFTTLAALNIFTDLAIAIVPLVLISSLRLGRTEKTGILFVFGIGSISIIASVARLVVITIRIAAHRMDWDSTHVMMLWNHAEIFFGVFAFMLPSFRFVLRRAAERFTWLKSSKGSQTGASPMLGGGKPFKSPPTVFGWITTDSKESSNDAQTMEKDPESPSSPPLERRWE